MLSPNEIKGMMPVITANDLERMIDNSLKHAAMNDGWPCEVFVTKL